MQIALTFAVFSNSLLAWAESRNYANVPKGFDERDLIYVLPQSFQDNSDTGSVVHHDLQLLRGLSGVVDAAPMNNLPAWGSAAAVYTSNDDKARELRVSLYDTDAAGPNVLGLQLTAGRAIRADDVVWRDSAEAGRDPSVVMISQSLADELFGDAPAVDKSLWLGRSGQLVQIIGVYRDVLGVTVENQRLRTMSVIRPLVVWQTNSAPNYLIRTEPGSAIELLETIKDRLEVIEGRYIHQVSTVDDLIARDLFASIAVTRVFGVISVTMLLVVSLGISGLAAYSVSKRIREIGTRRALGATRRRVIGMLVGEGLLTTTIGLVLGAALALPINYFTVRSGLMGMAMQPMYLLVAALFLLMLTAIAVYLPSRRAARLEPAIATRS
ncbi:ABC transporter permease [Aquimonas sp.]|uniref:ABC transporter permease n=1 Tax=Aquimonas sp. TaxID=1872588 RepID=UPI0037BFB3E8